MEAYTKVVCGWVKEVKVKKFPDHYLLFGRVLHSQKLNEAPTKPWVVLELSGNIVCAHCDCVRGLGEVCSHVAAVLFAVHAQNKEVSVTDQLAYWTTPGKKEIHLAIDEMDFSTPRALWKQQLKDRSGPRAESSVATKCKMSSADVISFLKSYKKLGCDSVLHNVLAPFQEAEDNSDPVNWLTELYSDNYRGLSYPELLTVAESVDYSVHDSFCKLIEEKTRDQSESEAWFIHRCGRVTASNLKDVCHTSLDKPSLSLIKKICYSKKTYFKAGIYGCEHEKEALKSYLEKHREDHPSCKIIKCGLIINCNYPHFGASPDGFVECEDCGNGCIEVKCPYCAKESSISELISIQKSCLKQQDNVISLDRGHRYYYQVQMQLALTGKSFCDFVVWSPKDFFIERITLDHTFWQEKSEGATNFFKNIILPELLAKYFTQKY